MGFMDKLKNMIGIEDEYYDEDYNEDVFDSYENNAQEPIEESFDSESKFDYTETKTSYSEPTRDTTRMTSSRPNIVNVSSSSNNKMKICIQEPLTYDDGPAVIDNISSSRTVVLNLEMLEVDKKRQIFDFVSGGVYALKGNIQKVTKDIYVIVPKGIEVDGKIAETVSNQSLYQL